MQRDSNHIFEKRRTCLQEKLKQTGHDGCLIENPLDLFYFTGLHLSLGSLLVHRNAIALIVDGRYFQVAKEKAGVPVILQSHSSISDFLKAHPARSFLFDSGFTTYERFLKLEKLVPDHENFQRGLRPNFSVQESAEGGGNLYQVAETERKTGLEKMGQSPKNFHGRALVADASFFKNLRSVKDAGEIEKMKRSAALCWKGFLWVEQALKEGITEKELARGFEIFCLQQGAEKLSFSPIIAFGANTAMPHYHPQKVALKKGDAVLVDIGVVLEDYHSDMTRVLFFEKRDPFIHSLYQVTIQAQKAALALCRPGVALGELDKAAREVFRRQKVEELFVHGLGHGIGLQTHEFPRIKHDGEDRAVLLEPGMVFTVEPGLYVPGEGGVRYEDTIVITEDGYENFYPEGNH